MVEEVQKESLRLMKEIDEICKKYDITYYGEGGTVIGALRHRGFIPWDDDMDIVMTRGNFLKFVEALKKENLEDRILEYPEGNKESPVVTIKYMDYNTTTIFKSLFLYGCSSGLNIDIFILDPIPKGKEKWFKKNFLSYCEILCPYYVINEESSYFRYRIDLLKEKLFGRDYVLNNYREKLFNFNEEDCEEYLVRWGITYQTVKIDYYKEPMYYKFCDMMLPIPSKAERILTNYFGDGWYIMPSEEEQESHDTIRNMHVGYTKYKDDYMKYIDKERVQKDFLKSKILRMQKLNFENKINKDIYNLNFVKDSIIVKDTINEEEIELLFDNNKYKELYQKLEKYISLQIDGLYRKNNLMFDVSKNIVKISLITLINVGKYYDAFKLISLFENDKEFCEIKETLLKIREAKYCYFENNYDNALEIVGSLLKENEFNMSAYKIKLDIILKNKLSKKDAESFIKEIEKYKSVTNDIELDKYLGDLFIILGKTKEAQEKYEFIKKYSRNGLLLLDIKETENK